MSNYKQSSVEILADFLLQHCNPTICNVEWSDFKLAIEQAKAMHKKEIENAHGEEQSKLQDDGSWKRQTAEQYYNETFGDKQT